jgi:hypothetical protein
MTTSERKCLTQPPDWWDAFNAEAKKRGMTLAAWMGDVCVAQLPKRVQASLSERPGAHRPKKSEVNDE